VCEGRGGEGLYGRGERIGRGGGIGWEEGSGKE